MRTYLHMTKLRIGVAILPEQRGAFLFNVRPVRAFHIHVHDRPCELHPGGIESRQHHLPPTAGRGPHVPVGHFVEETVFGAQPLFGERWVGGWVGG